MALTSLPNIHMPPLDQIEWVNYAHLLDAADEKLAYVFQIPKSGSITHVGFMTGAAIQAPANGLSVGLQTVSTANGDPTGSAYGGSVAGVQVPAATTWYEVALGTAATATAGDVVAVVIGFASFSASDSIEIWSNSGGPGAASIPYPDHYTSSWAKQANRACRFAIKYSDGSYGNIPGNYPYSEITYYAVSTSRNPDEIALRFTLPIPVRVSGWWAGLYTLGAGKDFSAVLYNAAGDALATCAVDGDQVIGTGVLRAKALFPTPVELAADTVYRLAIKPTTSGAIRIYYGDVSAAAVMGAMPMGTLAYGSHRQGGGAWTDVTTRRPQIGLIIDQVDPGGAVMLPEYGVQ